MIVLIADDNKANINVAKKAARKYPDHKFVFTTSAANAMKKIKNAEVDAVITDLFFPRKQLKNSEIYEQYINEYNAGVEDVIREIPDGMGRDSYSERVGHNRFILTESSFAAYGGAIALACIEDDFSFVIISEIHRHRLDYGSPSEQGLPARVADGVLLLAPLAMRKILTVGDLLNNRHDQHYLGMHYPKNEVDSWTKAIDMVLSQPDRASIKKEKEEEYRSAIVEYSQRKRRLREEQSVKLLELCGDVVISDALWNQLLRYANRGLKIVNQDIAIMQDSRSEWGSSGGIGYYDQIRIFCGSQSDMREWQWRDRYSVANDRHDLSIQGIGEVNVSYENNQIAVEIELINDRYGNRFTTFTFDQVDSVVDSVTLSDKEQVVFLKAVDAEIERILSDLNEFWKRKPQMLCRFGSSTGYTAYRRPSIKQKEVCAESGVAAFVIEEQIDHRGSDPQIRYDLFVLKCGVEKAERLAYDHGYEREGGAFLSIVSLNAKEVVISSKYGTSTRSL